MYFHPSRFKSIVERVSKNKYRCENLTLIGSPGKTINTNRIINKDDSGYFTNIDHTKYIQIAERFGNFFEDNNSFATSQVLNIHSPRGSSLILIRFGIDGDGNFSNDRLELGWFENSISKFASSLSVENSWAIHTNEDVQARLSKALGGTYDSITNKGIFVLSFSKNSEGLFSGYINCILITSHSD